MSKYEIDLRLPIDVWRRAPFIISGSDLKFLPLGVLADYIHHGGKQILRINPLILSKTHQTSFKQNIVFSFVFFYVNDHYKRVLFITHPINMGSVNREALEVLLKEIERIASLLDCQIIEVELNDMVEGSVAFPTSFSPISYDVEVSEMIKSDLDVFQRQGFIEWAEVECFENKVKALEHELSRSMIGGNSIHMTPIAMKDYLKTLVRMDDLKTRSFRLPVWDHSVNPLNLQLFNDSVYILRKAPKLGFFKSSECGYVRWIPNLMESLKFLGTPYLLLFLKTVEEYCHNTAKIIEWGVSSDDQLLNLLLKTAELMKKKGLDNIQFANVPKDQPKVKNLLQELGFRLIHRVKLLRREVE